MCSAAALIQIPPRSDHHLHLQNSEGSFLFDFLFKIVFFLFFPIFCHAAQSGQSALLATGTPNPFAAALYRVILHIRDKRPRSPEIVLSFLSEPVRCRRRRRNGKSQIRICILTAPFTTGDDVDASATLLCTRVLHACVASFFTLMDS